MKVFIWVFLLGVFAFAQELATDVTVTLEGYIVTTETHDDGELVEVFELAEEAQPGDLVEYRVVLSNASEANVTDAAAVGPVPASTFFLADSATQEATYLTEFSVDGSDYAQNPVITIINDDGEEEEVVAAPEDYTSVRWTLSEPLEPQASHSFSYRVQVR